MLTFKLVYKALDSEDISLSTMHSFMFLISKVTAGTKYKHLDNRNSKNCPSDELVPEDLEEFFSDKI